MTNVDMERYLSMQEAIQLDPESHAKQVGQEMSEFTDEVMAAVKKIKAHRSLSLSPAIVMDALQEFFSGTKFAKRVEISHTSYYLKSKSIIRLNERLGLVCECVNQFRDDYRFIVCVCLIEPGSTRR